MSKHVIVVSETKRNIAHKVDKFIICLNFYFFLFYIEIRCVEDCMIPEMTQKSLKEIFLSIMSFFRFKKEKYICEHDWIEKEKSDKYLFNYRFDTYEEVDPPNNGSYVRPAIISVCSLCGEIDDEIKKAEDFLEEQKQKNIQYENELQRKIKKTDEIYSQYKKNKIYKND